MAAIERGVAWLRGRRALVAALAVGWVAVIAVSAGRSAGGDAWVGIPDTDFLNYLFIAAMVFSVVITVLAMVLARGPGGKPEERRRSLWPMLVLLLIFLAVGQRSQLEFDEFEEEPPPPATAQPQGTGTETGPASPGRVNGGEFGILLVMLGAATAVVLWSRWRTEDELAPEGSEGESLEAALAPAVKRAGYRLLDESDPRSAVLLAYAELEETLGKVGQPPAEHETPSEHLRRVLAHLKVDTEPLYRLAELYQLARFSPRTISVDHQRDAAEALQRVQGELVAAA